MPSASARAECADVFTSKTERALGSEAPKARTTLRAEADVEERASKGGRFERRDWGKAWSGVFAIGSPATLDGIERIIRAFEAKHGHPEARDELREAALTFKGNAARILDYLESAHGWLHEDADSPDRRLTASAAPAADQQAEPDSTSEDLAVAKGVSLDDLYSLDAEGKTVRYSDGAIVAPASDLRESEEQAEPERAAGLDDELGDLYQGIDF